MEETAYALFRHSEWCQKEFSFFKLRMDMCNRIRDHDISVFKESLMQRLNATCGTRRSSKWIARDFERIVQILSNCQKQIYLKISKLDDFFYKKKKKKNLLSLIKISRFFNSKKFQFLSCMTPSSICQCWLLICQCRLNDRLSYYACMIKATLFFTVNEIYNKLFFTDITKERKIMYWNKDKWKKKKEDKDKELKQ